MGGRENFQRGHVSGALGLAVALVPGDGLCHDAWDPMHRLEQGRIHAADKSRVHGILDGLRRIVRDLRVSARDAERIAGISGAQLFVLHVLAEAPALSVGDLTRRTMTDQSSVSIVVQRLIDKRLVIRRLSAQDARRVELNVTAAGRRLLARCPEPTQARLVEALHRLAPSELAALALGMSAFVRAMGLGSTAPHMFFEDTASTPTPGGLRGSGDDTR